MAQVQLGDALTQGCRQLLMQDLDEGLPGREAAQYLRTDRPLAHTRHEVADHRQGNVSLDQRTPHIAYGILDILLGQPSAATHLVENAA